MRGGMFCCMCSALVGRLPFMARGCDALFAASVVLLVCIGGLTFLACACAFRGFLLVSTTRQLPCLIVTQGNQGRHDPHHHVLQFLRALLEILGANPGAQTRRKHLKRSLQLHMGMPPDTGNIQWIRDLSLIHI